MPLAAQPTPLAAAADYAPETSPEIISVVSAFDMFLKDKVRLSPTQVVLICILIFNLLFHLFVNVLSMQERAFRSSSMIFSSNVTPTATNDTKQQSAIGSTNAPEAEEEFEDFASAPSTAQNTPTASHGAPCIFVVVYFRHLRIRHFRKRSATRKFSAHDDIRTH